MKSSFDRLISKLAMAGEESLKIGFILSRFYPNWNAKENRIKQNKQRTRTKNRASESCWTRSNGLACV